MLELIVLAAVSGAPALAVDDAGLRRMIEATRQVCSDPGNFGYSADGTAQADASAKIPKVLDKLFELGLAASVKARGNVHEGPAQKDVGAVQVARLQCAEHVFGDLDRRFSLTNRSTGKSVAVGPNPTQTFKRLATTAAPTPAPTSTAITNSGPGDQAVSVGQTGGITAATIGTVTLREDRHIYLAMLQDIYSQGQNIFWAARSHYPSDQVTPNDMKTIGEWVASSANRITGMMTVAAAQSFMQVQRGAMSFNFDTPPQPPPSAESMKSFNYMMDVMPQYLNNVKYLMEHDTMDPQNKGTAP